MDGMSCIGIGIPVGISFIPYASRPGEGKDRPLLSQLPTYTNYLIVLLLYLEYVQVPLDCFLQVHGCVGFNGFWAIAFFFSSYLNACRYIYINGTQGQVDR